MALEATAPGGTVVCAGIHMSDIPRFPYRILWEERTIKSVANLTRRDAEEFLADLGLQLTVKIPDETEVERVTQLFNKTNQFNLTCKRYTASDVLEMLKKPC